MDSIPCVPPILQKINSEMVSKEIFPRLVSYSPSLFQRLQLVCKQFRNLVLQIPSLNALFKSFPMRLRSISHLTNFLNFFSSISNYRGAYLRIHLSFSEKNASTFYPPLLIQRLFLTYPLL